MSKIYFIILLLFSFSIKAQTSVLFLGNSYTYSGDVPGTLKSLAASGGHELYLEQNTPGGHQLHQHYENATSINKINSRNWDFVVLQQQSQMPYLYPEQTTYYANKIVRELIQPSTTATEPIIYMTWGRQEGNSWLTSSGLTYQQMSDAYVNYFTNLLDILPARMSPVGLAFNTATQQGINVYSSDGSHQNQTGSYLTACVFYATIFNETPVGLTYSPLSDTDLTLKLQTIAAETVLPYAKKWNIVRDWIPSTQEAKKGFKNLWPTVDPNCTPATTNIGQYAQGIYTLEIDQKIAYQSGTLAEDLYLYGLTKNGYVDNRYLIGAMFKQDSSYQLKIYAKYANHIKGYIDYNGNGDFEENENIVDVFRNEGDTTYSTTFQIPNNSVTDTLITLRIISDWKEKNPCESPEYGQVEDFGIWIQKNDPILSTNPKEILPTLYPNPVENILSLTNANNSPCQIINSKGQLIDSFTFEGNQLNISHLSSGIYFLKVNHLVYKFSKK